MSMRRRARPRRRHVAALLVCAGHGAASSVTSAATRPHVDAFLGWWPPLEPYRRTDASAPLPAAAQPDWTAARATGTLPRCAFPGAAADAPPPLPPRTLCVLGERHSGTNFVSSLLDANFAFADDDGEAAAVDGQLPLRSHPRLVDPIGRLPPRPGRVGHGCTAHKHAAQPANASAARVAPGHAPVDPADFLAVLVVRNVFDWAKGMHRAPWETLLPDAAWKNATLATFLAAKWPRGADIMSLDAPHAHAAAAMRAAKHDAWRALPWPRLELVQYECLLAGGGAGAHDWLSSLAARHGLPRTRAAAAEGWRLPGERVGGASAFAVDSLRDAGDDAAAARVQQEAADLAALERAAFPALAADALAPGAGPPPTALVALATAVVARADAAAEAELGYGEVMRLARRLIAKAAKAV